MERARDVNWQDVRFVLTIEKSRLARPRSRFVRVAIDFKNGRLPIFLEEMEVEEIAAAAIDVVWKREMHIMCKRSQISNAVFVEGGKLECGRGRGGADGALLSANVPSHHLLVSG